MFSTHLHCNPMTYIVFTAMYMFIPVSLSSPLLFGCLLALLQSHYCCDFEDEYALNAANPYVIYQYPHVSFSLAVLTSWTNIRRSSVES